MSIYGMYSKSFTPSVGVVNFSPNVRLLPMIGDIWEGGVKVQLTDRILWTTAGYWTKQHNVNVEQFNPAGPGLAFFATQAGVQRSQGVESSITGQITERLSTISNLPTPTPICSAWPSRRSVSPRPSTRPASAASLCGTAIPGYATTSYRNRTARLARPSACDMSATGLATTARR